MNDTMMKAVAACAAKWWSDQLAAGAAGDAGDDMINVLNRMAHVHEPVPDAAALAAFRAELERLVVARLADVGVVFLSVDYHPDRELTAALRAAGISAQLPIKTSMTIKSGLVEVKAGYGAQWERVSVETPAA